MEQIRSRFGGPISALAQKLHSRPELGLQEYETTKLICGVLDELGIERVDLGLATGAAGVLRTGKSGPAVGLRADIDALSQREETLRPDRSQIDGVMHACGHDVHTAGLLGAAMALAAIREELSGDVVFVFQPAEETLCGARLLIEAGLFSKAPVDCMFGLHNSPRLEVGTVGIREGHLMAAKDMFRARMTGRGGHSSAPQKNIDPILAAAAAVQGIHTIISRNVGPLSSAVVNVSYLSGGSEADLIVNDAVFGGTIRTHEEGVRARVLERLEEMTRSTAQAYGCRAEFSHTPVTPAVVNPPLLLPAARRAAAATAGEPHIVAPPVSMASEDFALYGECVPSFFYFLGSGTPGARNYSWHNPRFCAHEETPLYGAALLANSVLAAQELL
ncbi:MAG TPA: M20 family metallopeptidase [Feifaniaceae bacterium]|nr:M20 family metallopeptidase [Feifaniaceae bacterium]